MYLKIIYELIKYFLFIFSQDPFFFTLRYYKKINFNRPSKLLQMVIRL